MPILFELILKDPEIKLDPEDKLAYGQASAWIHEGGYIRMYYKGRDVYLHRQLMNPGQLHVDHINGNPKDNRKCNLRIVTRGQNMANSTKKSGNKSGYKGVTLHKGRYWAAGIMKDRKQIHIGYYPTAELAALAYNKKAIELHGEHAYQNTIVEEPKSNG